MRDETRRVETVWVPLTRVRIRERRLRGLSASTVDRYRLWLEQGREAPPVRLVRQGEWYLVRDGRHRLAAAFAAGLTAIEAEVGEMVWAAAASSSAVARVRSCIQLTWGRSTSSASAPAAGSW
jgi:hypothetical protein